MLHTLDDIVTLDWETYYSTEYSLRAKKYNTSGYIRDPQFKAHCIGIRDGRKPAVWYEHHDIPKALKKHAVAERPICAHHTHFDGFILSDRYGIIPPFYYCTLSMSRALHGHAMRHDLDTIAKFYGLGKKTEGALNKLRGIRDLPPELLEICGEYCCNDTDLDAEILAIQLANFPDDELRLIDWTVRAFCDPVLLVNQELARAELEAQIAARAEKIEAAQTTENDMTRDDRLKELLEALGVEVPVKFSPKTHQLVPAFSKQDKKFLDLLEHENDQVVRLVEARLATKSSIGVTRAQRFVDIGDKPLPMGLNYCGAHTTRWSGANKMNVQNLESSRKGGGKGALRRSIEAPPGHVIVAVDSKQIEARFNVWTWDQEPMLGAFRNGDDVYRLQAAQTYHKPMLEVSDIERFVGKTQILGLGYGMGAKKFVATLALGTLGPPLEISLDQGYQWVNAYRETNDKIVKGWRFLDNVLAQMALGKSGEYKCFAWEGSTVWLPNGLPLIYDGLRLTEQPNGRYQVSYVGNRNGKRTDIWGGAFNENWMQSISRYVIGVQKLLIIDAGWRVVGSTHDEIISIAPKNQAERCLDEMIQAMRHVPKAVQGAPLDAEGSFATNYS